MKLEKNILDKIYKITLESAFAKSKEVFIFELGEMGDFLGKEKPEEIRQFFLKNKIKVKQISNDYSIDNFSENKDFINKVMSFRYIPKDIFDIKTEILIFDDKIAFYNKKEFNLIENKNFADSQKQLFNSIWEQGLTPKLNFEYIPNHSYYKSIDLTINGIQVIVWPDFEAKKYYKDFNKEKLEKYIKNILDKNKKIYEKTSYIISFIWGYEGNKMIDIWNFDENFVDDKSGPLGNIFVYKNGEICTTMSSASGSSLLILGAEEKKRRQSKNLKEYLKGPIPKLPLEVCNGLKIFENL